MEGKAGKVMPDFGIEIPGGYFDEKKHLYRNSKGTIVPSTTQVFSILGCNDFDGIPQDVLEWKRNYGIAVHKAIEFLVMGDLDWDSLDEAIVPAVTGLEQKLKMLQFKYEAAEEMRIHSLYGMEYGLMADLRGTIVHQGKTRNAVIDLKSGVKFSPTWKWQVGGYTAAQGKVDGGWMGVVLQFDKFGEVKPHYIDLIPAQREFQILLAAANLKLNAGLVKLG
jgi:hypothetical protein